MTQLQVGHPPADPTTPEYTVLRALVVDDEPLARDRLVRLLAEIDDVRIVGECTSGEEAVESILTLAPDVVFLDVQMSNLDGVEVVIMVLAVLVMLAVHGLLRYTKLGKAMRATAANQSLARNCGIRTSQVIALTWAITGALCGLAGVVFAIDVGSFDATSTDLFLVLILAAVFLGGPGQAYGAMLGAVVIGLATEVSAVFIPADYKYVIAFVVLLVMLGVRPTGLLGARA